MNDTLTHSSDLLTSYTDDELAHEVGHGDADRGLRTLEQRYGKPLRHFVQRLVKDGHVADDVAQDVLEKIYFKHHLYTPGTSLRAWLFEIARNQALSTMRRLKRRPRPTASLSPRASFDQPSDLLDQFPGRNLAEPAEERELMRRLDQAIAELPEKYAQVFTLCVRQGKAYEEVARTLAIPTGTVAIRIMRARRRLFTALRDDIGRVRRPPACMQGKR